MKIPHLCKLLFVGMGPGGFKGKEIIITKEKVQELMDQVRGLVNHIEDQLNAPEGEKGNIIY